MCCLFLLYFLTLLLLMSPRDFHAVEHGLDVVQTLLDLWAVSVCFQCLQQLLLLGKQVFLLQQLLSKSLAVLTETFDLLVELGALEVELIL